MNFLGKLIALIVLGLCSPTIFSLGCKSRGDASGVRTTEITPAPAAGVTKYKVSVENHAFYFNDDFESDLHAEEGDTLVFDLSDGSLIDHQFYVKDEKGSPYAGAELDEVAKTLTMKVDKSTPGILYFSCAKHPNSGNTGKLTSIKQMGFLENVGNIKVTVKDFAFHFNDNITPKLNVKVGDTIVFDIGDESLSGHPFYITERADSRINYPAAVLDNQSRAIILKVDATTPKTLHYSCFRHQEMGGRGSIVVQADDSK